MAENPPFKCDNCGKDISGSNSIWFRSSLTDDVVVGFHDYNGRRYKRLDFCNVDCLIEFVMNLKEEVKKRY